VSTAYHSAYYAFQLTKRTASDNPEKLTRSLFDATIDINPHQVDAALFAFESPLSRGAILADEVGLGKTIEAGLVLSQLWAERKRRILVVVPTTLRKQWNRELHEKFFLPSQILESKSYNARKKAALTPFNLDDEIVICSYTFARNKAEDLRSTSWDLVILDEAHRLRNVYKKGAKIARELYDALINAPKLLLTATPLQNNLMELYGLAQFVDPHLFGDEASFRETFGSGAGGVQRIEELRRRIQTICRRTLRRQVAEYVSYTNRIAFTHDFTPTEREQDLYDKVSDYLGRESIALPFGQRQLITMVLRKLLASSSFAIAGTLDVMANRLRETLAAIKTTEELGLSTDYEPLEGVAEEWVTEDADASQRPPIERKALEAEIRELEAYRDLARSITQNAKGRELVVALNRGFEKLREIGAPEKAVIFTESRRTQEYVKRLLDESGYAGKIVLFNGSNNDSESEQIYRQWFSRYEGTDRVTGSATADMRSALVDEFRERGTILLATESAAEGVNLQFCALVVNYDLPWNPQRVEQRIGRCHRYGQKFDVVVINFVNRANAADVRVFELLSQKFQLFSGVFGASDEVLGAIESGVDFERRIAEIYDQCRTKEEIGAAFDALQRDLEEEISARHADTRRKLLERFDQEVHDRLHLRSEETRANLSRFEEWLWALTLFELGASIEVIEGYSFRLGTCPLDIATAEWTTGREYALDARGGDGSVSHYRVANPVADAIIHRAAIRKLDVRTISFHASAQKPNVGVVQSLCGQRGWLSVLRATVEAMEVEDHLVFVGITDDGTLVPPDICERMFAVRGEAGEEAEVPTEITAVLRSNADESVSALEKRVSGRNRKWFAAEIDKIENWAGDRERGFEVELKQLDRDMRTLRKQARLVDELDAKVEIRRRIMDLEKERGRKRRSFFDAQDQVEAEKEQLISEVERRIKQKTVIAPVFTIRWVIE
jgi:superfamily II DNA or RNA helicase